MAGTSQRRTASESQRPLDAKRIRLSSIDHSATQSKSIPMPRKYKSRSRFPRHETIGLGPDGDPITTSTAKSAPIPAAQLDEPADHSEPFVRPYFEFQQSLGLDFDPAVAPEPITYITADSKVSRHALRRIAAGRRWRDTVLPSLISPYMLWERQRTLRHKVGSYPPTQPCDCALYHWELHVLCVYQERLETITLIVCSSRPASLQLVEHGLFPCAPLRPTLAVCMNMLEFAQNVFVNTAPNERAWCAVLEKYLKKRGHDFIQADSLRRRFAAALAQYQSLIHLVDAEIRSVVDSCRGFAHSLPNTLADESPSLPSIPTVSIDILPIDCKTPVDERKYTNAHHFSPFSTNASPDVSLTRPSGYLRSRCPLCFGGAHAKLLKCDVDSIVCVDANFQQKRNCNKDRRAGHEGEAGAHDPYVASPRTVFVGQEHLDNWAARVEEFRSAPKAGSVRSKKGTAAADTDDTSLDLDVPDVTEPGMSIPNSVLDACGESFTAADGSRIKASTQFFNDTGLMAMLCRHDRPLFLANMRTAGESHHYAYALMDALMHKLPSDWRVGMLYDIGCQIERSVLRWHFAPEWESRFVFGVSIFHAYGHQWACQLWYHPRKKELWGLSDGEGCERVWNELRRLIPNLCVTGYHRRLFILDLQVEHIDESREHGTGEWLKKHVKRAQKRIAEAEHTLGNQSVEYLLQQFAEQRQFQSRPIERQSASKGQKAINNILSLGQSIESMQDRLKVQEAEQDELLKNSNSPDVILQNELRDRISATSTTIARLKKRVDDRISELRLRDYESYVTLGQLKKKKWLTHQLNLRVLRDQILSKLRARKFELSTLERAQTTRALDHKTQNHIEKAIKQRMPTIAATVKKYNDLLEQMRKTRTTDKAVRSDAYIPPAISTEGLYKLDVDQDIWQDPTNIDFAQFPGGKPPAWLSERSVRDGIRAAQETRNGQQELVRCKAELSNLRLWFLEEYAATQIACMKSLDANVRFFCYVELSRLHALGRHWAKSLSDLPFALSSETWPSPPLVEEVRRSNGVPSDGASAISSDDDELFGEREPEAPPADPSLYSALDAILIDGDDLEYLP